MDLPMELVEKIIQYLPTKVAYSLSREDRIFQPLYLRMLGSLSREEAIQHSVDVDSVDLFSSFHHQQVSMLGSFPKNIIIWIIYESFDYQEDLPHLFLIFLKENLGLYLEEIRELILDLEFLELNPVYSSHVREIKEQLDTKKSWLSDLLVMYGFVW